MAQVFVSYARSDMEIVDRVVDLLEKKEIDCWIDRKDIDGGNIWREEIVHAIRDARVFVIFLSHNSVKSDYVHRELAVAGHEGIRIIPVMLVNIEIPDSMKFQLAREQKIFLYPYVDLGVEKIIQALLTDVNITIRMVNEYLAQKGTSWVRWLRINGTHPHWHLLWHIQRQNDVNNHSLLEIGYIWFKENQKHRDWVSMLKAMLKEQQYRNHAYAIALHWLRKNRGHHQWEIVRGLLLQINPEDAVLQSMR